MEKKTKIIAVMVFTLGVIMLFGTSYSLITGNLTSDSTYGFDVAKFDVEFMDNTKITISGIPTTDEEALLKTKEYVFKVNNKSDYDINYRLDIIETGTYKMSGVIRYAYSINGGEYSDVITLEDNYTVKQNKMLKKGEIDTYKIKIWLSIDADESYMNKAFAATISLIATQNEYKYATTVIEKLASNNQDGLKKVDDAYRYSSKNSLNYVWFNCDNGFTKGENYCEKWQIIGSFMNKKEKSLDEYSMLKIVSTKAYEKIAYNDTEKDGDYANSYIETYANGSYYDRLNNDTKKLIQEARWNIGEVKSNTFDDAIKEEEEKVHYANVGLPNVSDYLYLNGESFIPSDNTLLLNKNTDYVNLINGTLIAGTSTENYNFVPCVYLRPDVSIMSGDGSRENPYELGIKFPMNY